MAKKENATVKKTNDNFVYIGPNLLSEGLKKYAIYRGDISVIIALHAEKHKNIGRLFVPVDNLNAAMKDALEKGTPINLAYAEAERGE